MESRNKMKRQLKLPRLSHLRKLSNLKTNPKRSRRSSPSLLLLMFQSLQNPRTKKRTTKLGSKSLKNKSDWRKNGSVNIRRRKSVKRMRQNQRKRKLLRKLTKSSSVKNAKLRSERRLKAKAPPMTNLQRPRQNARSFLLLLRDQPSAQGQVVLERLLQPQNQWPHLLRLLRRLLLQ